MHLRIHCRFFLVALALGAALSLAEPPAAPSKGLLGVGVMDAPSPLQGALVGRVVPDGAAARAGVLLQDLIIEADSRPVSSAAAFTAYVGSRHAGDRLNLTVMRRNGFATARMQLTATLDAAPESAVATSAAAAPKAPAAPAATAVPVTPAQGLSHVAWTTFSDPNETAFTIEVPQGWRVGGGAVRKNPLWANLVLRVLAPDHRTLLALGDPDSVPFTAPIAARDYVRRFTEDAMSSACSGLKIVDVRDLPDVERFASSSSLGPYNQWSAAQADFTCTGERQAGMSGQAIAVLQYMTTLRSGHAQVLAGFVTTAGQEQQADDLLNHMVQSLRQNPHWSARQQVIAEGLDRIAMAHWQAATHQFQQIDDAITNTAHFRAPDGRRYDLDARPRYQWRVPDGHTIGTDTPTPPFPGAQRLERQPE
jgi:PDZ domain